MPSIELSNDELEILEEYMQRVLSDLSVEISGTDRKEYRDEIKAERRLLQHVTEQLTSLKNSLPNSSSLRQRPSE